MRNESEYRQYLFFKLLLSECKKAANDNKETQASR